MASWAYHTFSRVLSPAGLVILLNTDGIASFPKGGIYDKSVVGLATGELPGVDDHNWPGAVIISA